ncbi:hypothetical protein Lal_00017026 [Lupinus albus]|nr:hypothetical protein Lal_00017026 [Lupinus albus]
MEGMRTISPVYFMALKPSHSIHSPAKLNSQTNPYGELASWKEEEKNSWNWLRNQREGSWDSIVSNSFFLAPILVPEEGEEPPAST